jgi:hypothetical protein
VKKTRWFTGGDAQTGAVADRVAHDGILRRLPFCFAAPERNEQGKEKAVVDD